MNDIRIRRLIMENLPAVPNGKVSKLFLKISVLQDASGFAQDITEDDFERNLSALNSLQALVIFEDNYIQATACGLRGFNLT